MIEKQMLIADIIKLSRKTVPVLGSFGMGCVGCAAANGETLEQAANAHGIDVDKLVKALNEVL